MPYYLRTWRRCRTLEEQEVNQVGQVGNVDCATAVNVTLFEARRCRALKEEVVHKVGKVSYVGSTTAAISTASPPPAAKVLILPEALVETEVS